MIHELNRGAWVISSYHVWRPGSYATAAAAKRASRFKDEELKRLSQRVNIVEGRDITVEDLNQKMMFV
jgi:hypothetical protein